MGADMTPDAFLDDWYAWATNQLSNVAISGGGLARLSVTFLPKITTRAQAISYILS